MALGQVKDRAAAWVAWSMLAIFVVGCGTAVTLEVTARGLGPGTVTLFLAFTGFMVVGAVIVAHRPDNAIGWIFSAIGLLAATGWLATEYALYAYVTRPGSLPGAIWAAWYQQQWWFPMFALIFVATPLLFPTGRLAPVRGIGGAGDRGAGAAGRVPADHQAAGPGLLGRQSHRAGRDPGP